MAKKIGSRYYNLDGLSIVQQFQRANTRSFIERIINISKGCVTG